MSKQTESKPESLPGERRFVALWAVPRSVSTAFEKTFSCRTDTRVVHEPYTDCYYFGPERRSARYGNQPQQADYDARAAAQAVFSVAAPVVFVKDLAFQAGPYLTDNLLTRITSTFIIRHPRRVLRSLTPLKGTSPRTSSATRRCTRCSPASARNSVIRRWSWRVMLSGGTRKRCCVATANRFDCRSRNRC